MISILIAVLFISLSFADNIEASHEHLSSNTTKYQQEHKSEPASQHQKEDHDCCHFHVCFVSILPAHHLYSVTLIFREAKLNESTTYSKTASFLAEINRPPIS